MEAYYNDAAAQRNAERALSAGNPSLGPKLDALFDKYSALAAANPDKDIWSIDATIAWCEALDISPEDPIMLAVADLCGATEMGTFERKAWVNGWKKVKVDSITGQRTYITSTLKSNLSSQPAYFRKVYNFTFDYARDKSQRGLPLEVAAPMWMLLVPMAPKEMFEDDSAWCSARDKAKAESWLQRWCDFLGDEKGNKGRPISKDVWSQFLDFACQMDEDLDSHDPGEGFISAVNLVLMAIFDQSQRTTLGLQL